MARPFWKEGGTLSASTDFLDLLRELEGANIDHPRIGQSGSRQQEIVLLGQEPHIDFSDDNVMTIGATSDGKPTVVSRFLGLMGPQGALPLHTTYEARHWLNMRDPSFARFADLFNNRFLQLYYRAWANARPAVQADRPKDNQFTVYLGSAIGIGTWPTQNRDSINDFTKLALAGLLAPAVKSASRLESMLSWMFNVATAVEQFVGSWLPLDRQEQAVLSKGNCSLGVDSLVGSSAFSLHDTFRIKIAVRNLQEFESFLPSGKHFRQLADAVLFYAGSTYIYDVMIGIPENQTRPVQLGTFGRLGWTSWTTKPNTVGSDTTRWDCRFHPGEMT